MTKQSAARRMPLSLPSGEPVQVEPAVEPLTVALRDVIRLVRFSTEVGDPLPCRSATLLTSKRSKPSRWRVGRCPSRHTRLSPPRQGALPVPRRCRSSLTADSYTRSFTWTYAELLAEITRAANAFHALGVSADHPVAFVLPNLPETHFTIWGGEAAGVVFAINPLLEPRPHRRTVACCARDACW